jgi:hypothetical protein
MVRQVKSHRGRQRGCKKARQASGAEGSESRARAVIISGMKSHARINLTNRNSQRYAEAVRLYRSGLSMAEVGQRLAISGERVRQILVKSGVTERVSPGKRSHLLSLRRLESQRDRLTKMTQSGKWPAAIARELAMCPESVMRWLRLLGITPARKRRPEKVVAGIVHYFCCRCRQWHPIESFYGSHRKQTLCKRCFLKYCRDRYKKRMAGRRSNLAGSTGAKQTPLSAN